MVTVNELINEINANRNPEDGDRVTYETKSQKDELAVMKAMLNDKTYKVDVYGPDGVEETICPSEIIRSTMASVVSGTTGMSYHESEGLMNSYEFKTSEANNMIKFSKEFVNTYLKTGRKLPLGGRETSNVSLSQKLVPAGYTKYPVKVGVDVDGNNIYEPGETYIDQYHSVRVFGPCPSWVKNKHKEK